MHHLKRLLLLRHAHALPASMNEKDFERNLSVQGIKEAANIGNILREHYQRPDKVILSPSKRTTQTAKALNIFKEEELIYIKNLYEDDATGYLSTIKYYSDCASLLLIGHNPSIFMLLQFLTSPKSATKLPYMYPPAGLAILDFAKSEVNYFQHCAQLIAFHNH